MKILYKFMFLIVGGLFMVSCLEQEESFEYTESGVAMPKVGAINQAFFNLLDLNNAYAEFELDILGAGGASVEMLINFNGGEFSSLSSVSTFPATVNISLDDAVAATGQVKDDLVPGDNFGIIFRTTTNSGTFETSEVVSVNANCPSEIPEGLWTSNVPDGSGGFYKIEITANGGGSYSITNFNLDFQPPFYATFTTLPIGGGFDDVCNDLTLNHPGQYGVVWTADGTYDPVAGTITFASVSDPGYGQGPWNNGGAGYVFTAP